MAQDCFVEKNLTDAFPVVRSLPPGCICSAVVKSLQTYVLYSFWIKDGDTNSAAQEKYAVSNTNIPYLMNKSAPFACLRAHNIIMCKHLTSQLLGHALGHEMNSPM